MSRPGTVLEGEDNAVDGIAVRFWTPDRARQSPMPVGTGLDVLDLRGSAPDTTLLAEGAGLLLAESEAAAGVWWSLAPSALVAVVPPVVTTSGAASSAFEALHVVVGAQADAETMRLAERAAAWAASRNIACGLCDVEGAAGLALLAWAPGTAAQAGPVLDLRRGVDLLVSGSVLEVMAAGASVLFLEPTPWRDGLAQAGAGLLMAGLEAGLDGFARLPATQRGAMSAAALDELRRRHSQAAADAAMRAALAAGAARVRALWADWPARTAGTHVLVISDEALNLLDIRVHLPFRALRERGAIAGYSILQHGEWAYSTVPVTPALQFGAIWVQRSFDPLVALLLAVLGRPYVYDLDDLLLVSPSYRPQFPDQSAATVQGLIEGARVLSCATGRLAMLTQAHGAEGAVAKTVVTPNLAGPMAERVAGAARTVVWASSDAPALTGSRAAVEHAVRDFCRAHRLRLLCMGAPPPAAFAGSELVVEHAGLMSYPAYLQRLRDAAPGILVGPLETMADGPTQDFIDAKSDIKVIEAGLAGLVGVFSRAAPYAESDLAPAILCDNTYDSWLDGLERARRACAQPGHASTLPHRAFDETGPLPWAEALRRAATDLDAGAVADAVGYVRARGETLLSAPERFDEADYLRRHDDVRDAVQEGVVASGYRHYVQSGFREGRDAQRLPSPDAAAEFWWSRLLHETGRLERRVAARERSLGQLRDRAALRRRPELAGEAPPAESPWIDWAAAGSVAGACPVCEASGPHPTVLVAMGQTLGRCGECHTCFYERREPYDYEDPAAADVLLQLNLEQNAGIHHQTRPLFAIEDCDSVLDVGCGFGFTVDLAAKTLGWRATGLDPSFYAEAGARLLGAAVRPEYLTEASELGGGFSLVLASEVIEHLPEPQPFLAMLRSQLAPGGTLALSTPNAAAIRPDSGASTLLAVLAPRVHMVLFTRESLTLALSRAGFGHVRVEEMQDGLLAYASDRKLRFRADAAARHDRAYEQYLEALMDRSVPGSALWNGAVGRLLAWRAPSAPLDALQRLFARVDAAWRKRFGIDIARHRWPTLPRGASAATIGTLQPFNLAGVLLARALLAARTPGRRPQDILAYARPAFRIAATSGQALQAANMVDHDLRQTARRSRMLVLDALAELAPEMEAELLQGLLVRSPGALADWVDPPPPMLRARLAVAFAGAVGADRFDDARRLLPALGDVDDLCAALAADDEALLRSLFGLGVLRLVGDGDAAGALAMFQRMRAEARARRSRGGAVPGLLALAEEHIEIAEARLAL